MTQYRHSLRDLLQFALKDASEVDVVLAQAALADLPEDRREPVPQDLHGSYRRLDQALEQQHVDGMFRVASVVSGALTQPEHLGRVVGMCAVDADAQNDEPCLNTFLQHFGARVLRRPLDADDLEFYRGVYGAAATSSPAAYADVIAVLLNAPEFLYMVEHGARAHAAEAGMEELSAHEIAARLSYHFWETTPDGELWQVALDGSLRQSAVYEQQVERLVNDARAQRTFAQFFSDWLKVEDLPQFGSATDPLYRAFAGPHQVTPDLRQAMIDDVLAMVAYYARTPERGFAELFLSELSFARSAELAAIYGVAPWDGTADPPHLPPGQRVGLLTRALFVANGSANTRPIMKGVFIRRSLLCDDIPPPPAGVNAVPPGLRADMTTRQVVEALTEQPASACAGCHATLINPLGFITEGFDALGRFRTEQALFAADGSPTGALPIVTHAVPRITSDDESLVSGPAELAWRMLQSGKLEACLARNYFRFTFGRWEDDARDRCVLERLRTRLVETGSISELFKEVALTPAFRQRSFD